MADRILTFQQSSVMQDVELFLESSKKGQPPERLREIFHSILALVEDEQDIYPEELRPVVFFKGRTVFGSRASRPMIRLYLHKLHRHLDGLNSNWVQR